MNIDGNVKVVCVQWQAVCQFGLYGCLGSNLLIFTQEGCSHQLDPANDSLPHPLSLNFLTNAVVCCSIISSIGNFLDVNIEMSVL